MSDIEKIRGLVANLEKHCELLKELVARDAAQLATVTRERDAYKKAKEENDERFMLERDEARRERDEARALLAEARKGKPIGPIVGAMTIVEQELELEKLRAAIISMADEPAIKEDRTSFYEFKTLAAALGDTTGGTGDGA